MPEEFGLYLMICFRLKSVLFSGKTTAIDETELAVLPEVQPVDKLLLVINPLVLHMHLIFSTDCMMIADIWGNSPYSTFGV